MPASIYESFTNKYSLSKTLRFRLKPVLGTETLLQKNNVIAKDTAIDEAYHNIKYYFDLLHRKFIGESLTTCTLPDLKPYLETYQKYKKEQDRKAKRKIEDDLSKEEKKLRKEIVACFNKKGQEWKSNLYKDLELDKDGYNILFGKKSIFLLNEIYKTPPNEEAPAIDTGTDKNLFLTFKGFTTYFSNFEESRKNFYKDDGTSTAVATRAIDDNLKRFCDNIFIYSTKLQPVLTLPEQYESIFNIDQYHHYLTQEGIKDYEKCIGEINKDFINPYNQQQKPQPKLPQLKILYKQILGEEKKQSDFIEFHDEIFFQQLAEHLQPQQEQFQKIYTLFTTFYTNLNNYELDKIYVSNKAINTISQKYFGSWETLQKEMLDYLNDGKKKKDIITKIPDFVSYQTIADYLETKKGAKLDVLFKKELIKDLDSAKISLDPQEPFQAFITIQQYQFDTAYEEYTQAGKALKEQLTQTFDKQSIKQKEVIKTYADTGLRMLQMAKYVALEKGKKKITPENGTDNTFYNEYIALTDDFNYVPFYNALRNFMTKKPFSTDKIKLNFEKGTLLTGWSENSDGDLQYSSTILRKDGQYYLAVLLKPTAFNYEKNSRLYDVKSSDLVYEKMVYTQLKSNLIYGNLYEKAHKSSYASDKETLSDQELITRVKHVLKSNNYHEKFPQLQPLLNTSFDKANEFATELNKVNLYSLEFIQVDGATLESLTADSVYLFEITSKDFLKHAHGNKDLQTLYFLSLFDPENLKDPRFKLSGGGEVFYRPASLAKESDEERKKQLAKSKNNRFITDITRSNRYTEDRYFFHMSVIINPSAATYKFNDGVNTHLKKHFKDLHVIGIDRGEKHLIYYSLLTPEGKLIKTESFNTIPVKGKEQPVDYLAKLETKETERKEARVNWQAITNIKDLKEGYISQVVKHLADMVIEYNAVIVFENLNSGFKRGRQKIERQVYQKLELALAKKLNYLVQKEKQSIAPGGMLNGYQLTPAVNNYQDIEKWTQVGNLLYVQASYTSITDPATGFRKNLYLSKNVSEAQMQEQVFKLKEISWNQKYNCFRITYNPHDFSPRDIDADCTIYSCVERYINSKDESGNWKSELVGMTEKMNLLFQKHLPNLVRNSSILEQIKEQKDTLPAEFFRTLIAHLNLILQLRNSKIHGKEDVEDFIQSPVEPFFDSRYPEKNAPHLQEIRNGDANGAYHIGLRGLEVLRKRIKE